MKAARREARANLGAAVDRAIHLVEQLLTLARSEPREEPREWSRIPLEQATADGIADANALAVARRIDLGLEAVARGGAGRSRCAARSGAQPRRQCGALQPEGGQVRVSTHQQARPPRVLEVAIPVPAFQPRTASGRSIGSIAAASSRRVAAVWALRSSRRSRIATARGFARGVPAGGL